MSLCLVFTLFDGVPQIVYKPVRVRHLLSSREIFINWFLHDHDAFNRYD